MHKYLIPAEEIESQIEIKKSRFIVCIAPAFSVDEARRFISDVKKKHPNANHHVSSYIIGHGNSEIAHCTDDGEPSGTAGRPALAVLQGSGLGDVVAVIVRYFGGIKLGTGGLVRAYSGAVKQGLSVLPRGMKVPTYQVMMGLPTRFMNA
ncbi:MAG: YigZ family protein [Anaerolineaceae bacterium]|nr:YigZ family protein [Anaerolineaceae bacterium]